jgi:predicted O-methyltransferase YrrM
MFPPAARVKSALKRVPGVKSSVSLVRQAVRAARILQSPFVHTFEPGSFYSPLPSEEDLQSPGVVTKTCPGVDLHETEQLELIERFSAYYAELPFPKQPTPNHRYHFENHYFTYCDAVILYCMLRHHRPRRIVEVGSGFSSAAMLDTRDRFLDRNTQFTFIDPFPQRLETLLVGDDHTTCRILATKVQDVAFSTFDELTAGDFLFVDSSHVVKLGSDVSWLFFEVLPRLKPGVVIHFHDVFWPFDYPDIWLRAGRAWNEAYVLRSFLQYNNEFALVLFNDFLKTFHADTLRTHLPLCLEEGPYAMTLSASSVWLVKR